MSTEQLDDRTARLLSLEPDAPVPEAVAEAPSFSLFRPADQRKAIELAAHFMEIANNSPGEEGLAKVLDEAERVSRDTNAELVRYALMVFITHHPKGRTLPIPPLDVRLPSWVTPSNNAVRLKGVVALGALGAEAQLDYFREDTAVNDHHSKWHIVYPASGHPDPDHPDQRITKDRQGELFWYMHQQMIARYDAERRAFGLLRVVPLQDYRQPIAEGYKAELPQFSDRAPNQRMKDVDDYPVSEHETRRDRLVQAARAGKLRRNGTDVAIDPSLFADTIEANIGSADGEGMDPASFYGQLHNYGHVLLSALADPAGAFPKKDGVMAETATAVRDPVFWRWHKHVDDIFVLWQQDLPAHDFAADAPPVRLRKQIGAGADADASPDIIFCRAGDLPDWGKPGFNGQQLGEQLFGGANWDRASFDAPAVTDELRTFMLEEEIRLNRRKVKKPYLDHEEFGYFLRLENESGQKQSVTVRVFIAPAEDEIRKDRRAWIEMDKFTATLNAHQKSVLFRSERQSSVVRKPARRPSEPGPAGPSGTVDHDYCDCGWPLHLLLPRGTKTGMEFVAFVMLTDFEQDMVGAETKCGSMSFCGARDARYPDKRPMGYPFDRKFINGIAHTVAARPNMATRKFKLIHGDAP